MAYFIIIAATIFALYLIFREDKDKGYNNNSEYVKDERSPRRGHKPRATPAWPTAKAPVLDTQKRVPEKATVNPKRQHLSWQFLYSLEYDDSLSGDTMETEITGMRYYCTEDDLGLINGTVQPEPANPHDHRAHVVVRADGKKLGYIPRYDLDDYEDFNEDDLVCPFVGEAYMTSDGWMKADILVALPESREFVKEELSGYIEDGD